MTFWLNVSLWSKNLHVGTWYLWRCHQTPQKSAGVTVGNVNRYNKVMNRRKLCHHQQIHGLTASITPFFNVSLLVVLSSLQEAFILNSKCSESTVWSSENEMKFKWYWIMVKNHLHSFIIIFPNYLFSQVKVTFTFIYVWFFQTTCSHKWKSHLHGRPVSRQP